MIGIDTLPSEDAELTSTADNVLPMADAVRLRMEKLRMATDLAMADDVSAEPEDAEGDALPVVEPAAENLDAVPAAESAEDLLRRLEEEKEEWQRQLAAMKETLEAQDRKIEEDRSKRRDYLEKEEAKTQIVPVNKAPTRTLVKGTNQISTSVPKIPVVTERTRTMWTGMTDFHTRRAKTVAKTMPGMTMAYENYLQSQYGMSMSSATGPSRPMMPTQGAITKYTAAPQGQRMVSSGGYPDALRMMQQKGYTMDGMGRMVSTSKVLTGPRRNSFNASTAVVNTMSLGPPVSGVSLMSSQQSMPVASFTRYTSGPGASPLGSALVASTKNMPSMSGSPVSSGGYTVYAPAVAPVAAASSVDSSWLGGTWSYIVGSEAQPAPMMGMSVPATPCVSRVPMDSTPMQVYRIS